MLLRSAAIGVRNSCDASAIRCRWAWIDRSSASSVRLKLVARRRSSLAPVSCSRCGLDSVLVTCSVRSEKRVIGASAERAISVPSRPASSTPPPTSSA